MLFCAWPLSRKIDFQRLLLKITLKQPLLGRSFRTDLLFLCREEVFKATVEFMYLVGFCTSGSNQGK